MPNSIFNTAQHELTMYLSAVKDEEKMFTGRNISFSRENPQFETLCVINPVNDNEYWGYAAFMEGLGEDDINAHIKMHEFLLRQLRFRLRTKSKEANVVRADAKKLRGIFKEVADENKIGDDDSASL